MREFGGYIELDSYSGHEYHSAQYDLNCGCSALSFLIEARGIKKLYIPYYLCDSITQVCEYYRIDYEYYHINENFFPMFNRKMKSNEYIYIVNYYGQISNSRVSEWQKKYVNVILDNVQAFFQYPVEGIDTLYTCRKYFGVPDGAYLYTDSSIGRELEIDISYERMKHLLGRYEKSASEFYHDYQYNESILQMAGLKKMSKLTHNLLRAINYEYVKKKREENFIVLQDLLSKENKLSPVLPEGAFMYPLLVDNGREIRSKLVEHKIYIPVLWPNVESIVGISDLESIYAQDILPLPCDQRYNIEDMILIGEAVLKCFT